MHVGLIDQMDRNACKDHCMYRLFIEKINISTIQTIAVKLHRVNTHFRSREVANAIITVDADCHAHCTHVPVFRQCGITLESYTNLSVSAASLSIMDVPLKCDSNMYSWLEGGISDDTVIFSIAPSQQGKYIHAPVMWSSLRILVGRRTADELS